MRMFPKTAAALLCMLFLAASLSGCSSGEKRIVRIGHNQATDHPTNVALLAFEEYIEGELGDRYEVEVYPSELLGSQTDMVQLTQTGAIDFCVASNSILETFSKDYTLFNLPYLFVSSEAYHQAMDSFCAAGADEEDRDYLKLFSFIASLSFDVYVKKLLI